MTKFSKYHYELLADLINELNDTVFIEGQNIISTEQLIDRLIEIFEADNPRFDASRSKTACRVVYKDE